MFMLLFLCMKLTDTVSENLETSDMECHTIEKRKHLSFHGIFLQNVYVTSEAKE
jgi:hypothetical protein